MNFLILRSYGDFVILLTSIKSSNNNEVKKIYVSNHLKNLYNSLSTNLNSKFNFIFIDFNIQTGILPLLTNKYLFSIKNVYSVLKIRHFIINSNLQNDIIHLEQKRKSFFFKFLVHSKTNYIHKGNQSIYDSYFDLFKTSDIYTKLTNTCNSILIFPDSRKTEKVLSNNFLEKLQSRINFKNVTIARFDKKQDFSNNIFYSNFDQLVSIIEKADLIITSDSLPAHLSQYLKKPHFILYNNKINYEWLTPFSKNNNTYYITKEADLIVNHLKHFLC
jgi:ADP-heptose:LPS heptosyltransferase